MTVALDTSVQKDQSDIFLVTLSFSHTMSAAADGILFFAVCWRLLTPTYTSVKYNGVDMSLVESVTSGVNTGGVDLFALANPASGAHNLIAVFNTAPTRSIFYSVSFTGAYPWWRAYAENIGTALPSLTLAGDSNDISVMFATQNSNSGDTLWTETAGTNRLFRNTYSIGSNGMLAGVTYKPGSNPSTISYASGTTRSARWLGFSVKPPSSFVPRISFL